MRLIIFAFAALSIFSACDPKRPSTPAGDDSSAYGSAREEKMQHAIAQARGTLAIFERTVRSPLPGQTAFAVRAGLPYPGGVEHVWLSNPVFSGDTVTGTVENAAINIPGVKPGQVLMVERKSVSDWMYMENGEMRGGYTEKVLRESRK